MADFDGFMLMLEDSLYQVATSFALWGKYCHGAHLQRRLNGSRPPYYSCMLCSPFALVSENDVSATTLTTHPEFHHVNLQETWSAQIPASKVLVWNYCSYAGNEHGLRYFVDEVLHCADSKPHGPAV